MMSLLSIKRCRRLLQIGVAVAFIMIPWLNRRHINLFYGNFLSFNAAGLPLADPLAALQVFLKSGDLSTHLLIGAGIALLAAACLGTVFCSWVCPFGLLSEWTHALSRKILPEHRGRSEPGRRGFLLKSLAFASVFVGFALFSDQPVLNHLSLPGWYSRIFQVLAGQKYLSLAVFALLSVLLFEFATRSRLWCRYLCPQAYLLILAKLAGSYRLKVGWQQAKCICANKSVCAGACSFDLDPRRLGDSLETECTNCGDCITACGRMGGALKFGFGKAK